MSQRRSIADFPRNEAGLVDEFIGTAYDVVKNVSNNMEELGRLDGVLAEIPTLAESVTQQTIDAKMPDVLLQIDSRIDAGMGELDQSVIAAETAANQAVAAKDATVAALPAAIAESKGYTDTLRDDLGSSTGSQIVMDGVRTQYDRNRDFINVRDYITTPVDGTTDNTIGILAALAVAIAQGKDLEWPAGAYVALGNLADFFLVTHTGRGVLKRNGSTYYIQPRGKAVVENHIYVARDADPANDGLTPSTPLNKIQLAFDAIERQGDYHFGSWFVDVQQGSFSESSTLTGISFRRRLVVRGPTVASNENKQVAIDGTGISTTYLAGMTFDRSTPVQVRYIKFQNWTGATGVGAGGANTGLVATDNSNVWSDDCDYENCDTGFGGTRSRMYQGLGRVTDCAIGSTAFSSAQCSFGYGGPTSYLRCGVGVNVRDSTSGVVDSGNFHQCTIGVRTQYGGALRISNCIFTESVTADVYGYTGGFPFFGEGNTHTPGKKFKGQMSTDLGNAGQLYFDIDRSLGLASGRGAWNLGLDPSTPNYRWHIRDRIQNAFPPSTSHVTVEHETPQIGLAGPAGTIAGINVAIPALPLEASFTYYATDKEWRMRANNTDAYRFSGIHLRPATDGGQALGHPSYKFSVLHAATGTIATSDERYKTQKRTIDEACLRAWGKVNFCQFKMLDAVQLKGDGARWHFGVIAQEVKVAFESEGLNAEEYGVLCYDEWPEIPYQPAEYGPEVPYQPAREAVYGPDGELIQPASPEVLGSNGPVLIKAEVPHRPAGYRYGIRYEQALVLECAYLRSRLGR